MSNRLQNKVAVLTGASSGVGKAAAKMMAAEGASVVLAARSEEKLNAIVEEIRAAGGTAFAFPCDVTDSEKIKALVDFTVEKFGKLDVFVNSAGILEMGLPAIDKFKDEDLEKLFQTNTKGTMCGMREASRAMLKNENGGSIINVASVSGIVGNGGAAYVASKGAILAAARHAALRLNRNNIRVNCICPGSINTPMNKYAQTIPDMDLIGQLMLHADLHREPMVCEPEHVGHLIVYLASDESAPVTGQSIVMDYGVNL